MEAQMLNTADIQSPAAAKRLTVERADLIAALASFLVAFAYAEWIVVQSPRWGYAAFAALFLVCVEAYCVAKHRPAASWESRLLGLCLLAVAIARLLFHGQTVRGYDMLFLHGMACYYALGRTGLLTEGRTGPLFACDLISAGILLPFANLFLRCRMFCSAIAARRSKQAPAARKAGWAVLLAALVALALFLAASRILSDADPFFAESVGRFLRFDLSLDAELVLALLISLPVGAYLFGLVGGAISRGKPSFSAERVRAAAGRARIVPAGAAIAILASFLALYALFFAFQGSYLFGALRGMLPADFTAAAYARQGFFELCEIVALNFVLLTAVAKTARTPLRESAPLRALALMLLACSALFSVVAASKMALYVTRFGMTQLRLLASFAMLVLFLLTCLAALDVLRPFPAVRTGLLLAAALFALLCVADPDARIIEINLAQYQSGAVAELDVGYLSYDCGARENPARFYRQLEHAGYFAKPRTYGELTSAFGIPNEKQALADGRTGCVWTGPRGECLYAACAADSASKGEFAVLSIGTEPLFP